jgi:threonine/homoserine/homoserine lactone efflux protein
LAAADLTFWGAFSLFAFVTSVTPGPNNTMMMASGANFGVARTLPHMAGVVLGFTILILAVGLGLGVAFAAWPALQGALYWLGSAYLLYLAWTIATAAGIAGVELGRPMTFAEAVGFQWVNPKAWTGAIGAVGTYAPHANYFASLSAICAIFLIVNIPVTVLWTAGGVAMKRALRDRRALRAFNIAMGTLLALSIPPIADRTAAVLAPMWRAAGG